MNSGMKIKELQNQDENISILAAQREMYTQAKRYGSIHTVVSLGIPLVVFSNTFLNKKWNCGGNLGPK